MLQTCRNSWCQSPFEVTEADLRFLDEHSPTFAGKKELIPPPTLCPDCRQIRRQSFRNLHHLYRNRCGLTEKDLVTNVSPDKPYPVYAREVWLGDLWDPLSFGTIYDPSVLFTLQVGHLWSRAPRWSNYVEQCENCDFCMNCYGGRDSYLVTSCGDFQRCLYCHRAFKCYECLDCLNLLSGEQSYECTDCEDLHHCTELQNCKSCSDCDFCMDCTGCDSCLLCMGLRQKRHCIENTQYSPTEYSRRRAELIANRAQCREDLIIFSKTVPHIAVHQTACEATTADAAMHCKDVDQGFYVTNCEDTRIVYDSDRANLCLDVSDADYYTACYETASAAYMNACAFCENSIYLTDCLYCSGCQHCEHCFGCISLKRKSYCILNTQYTKEEYETLVPNIIERMRHNGEWGEFFATSISPFAYNESVAMEYAPITKEQALERGWKWRDQVDEMPKVDRVIPAAQLPSTIEEVPDDILNWAIECAVTKRPFKIIKQELQFYRQMNLPIPHSHPDERHRRRMQLRNPRKLWKRHCAKCGKEMETTYAPERPEIVYCEECYLKEVY